MPRNCGSRFWRGDSPDACNDVARPNRVVPDEREVTARGPFELPPHSVGGVCAGRPEPSGPSADASKLRITFLAGDSPDACNDVARPNRVVPDEREVTARGPFELPPHSVAVVRGEA